MAKKSLNVVICLELRTFLLKEIPFIRQTGGDMVGVHVFYKKLKEFKKYFEEVL